MPKKYGEDNRDKYIEKIAVGRYKVMHKFNGEYYRGSIKEARILVGYYPNSYKEVKKKMPHVVLPTKQVSIKESDYPMEVRYGGKVYKLQANIDIHFNEVDKVIYITHVE